MKLIYNATFLFLISITLQAGPSKLSKKFRLITSLYNETSEERINEYLTCLENNLAHPEIDSIHIIYDSSKDDNSNQILNYIKQKKVTISYYNGRPSYQYCFSLANKLYPSKSKIILSNADIYFNDTLKYIENYNLKGKFLAITRWNVIPDGKIIPHLTSKNLPSEHSQDTWIFELPIKKIKCNDIQMGTKHCDGRMAYEIHKSGLKVLNPCLTIQCCHLHLSDIRNYSTNNNRDKNKTMGVSWSYLH